MEAGPRERHQFRVTALLSIDGVVDGEEGKADVGVFAA